MVNQILDIVSESLFICGHNLDNPSIKLGIFQVGDCQLCWAQACRCLCELSVGNCSGASGTIVINTLKYSVKEVIIAIRT